MLSTHDVLQINVWRVASADMKWGDVLNPSFMCTFSTVFDKLRKYLDVELDVCNDAIHLDGIEIGRCAKSIIYV